MVELQENRLCRDGPPPPVGIVHLGPGAFFRAHLAQYTDEAMAASGGDWGITAVSLRSPNVRDQLAPQGGVYTAVELHPEGRKLQLVRSINQVIVAPQAPDAVIDLISDPAVKIVSLTITEKGYCHDPATGRLNPGHPDIVHDLGAPDAPVSAVGYIVAGLGRRMARHGQPLSVLSCDNLAGNGEVTRAVVTEFAELCDPTLAIWIAENVRFPSTMVDRITPATTAEDIEVLQAQAGYHDAGAVVHEPFRQWVIEDDFAAGRPDWAAAGAEMVRDVAPFERMKLRCLNGAHSAMAYLAGFAGHETMAAATNDPAFAGFCSALWQREICPTVPPPDNTDLSAYCNALLARFKNPAIQHKTAQVAMDGSQKLPARIVAPLEEHLAEGGVAKGLCLVLAAWMHHLRGVDEAGGQAAVSDPLADALQGALRNAANPAAKAAAILSFDQIFPAVVAENADLLSCLAEAYEAIETNGARNAAMAYSETST